MRKMLLIAAALLPIAVGGVAQAAPGPVAVVQTVQWRHGGWDHRGWGHRGWDRGWHHHYGYGHPWHHHYWHRYGWR